MTAYDDLLRALLVERFAPCQEATDPAARLAELNKDLRSERRGARPSRRSSRRPTDQPKIIDTTRRTP